MDYRLTILFVLSAGAYAGPAGRMTLTGSTGSTCSTTCTASSKFSYAPGTTYEYKYEVETKTAMLGASEDQSVIAITAIAAVEVHSKCEMILTVRDVSVLSYDSRQFQDQDKSGKFAKALQEYPLRFGFQDGVVDSVCPHLDETARILNIKKGMLSTFQNTMVSFVNDHSGIESDVTGKCKTEYKVTSDGWRSVSLKKTKQMDECTHRQGFESAIQTAPYRLISSLKSLPILRSTHECSQEVNKAKGTLTSTLCHEMHILRPFSKEASGAATETTQKLTFIQEIRGLASGHATVGQSQALHYEHIYDQDPVDLTPKDALNLLKDVCKSTVEEIQPDTPSQFSSLVTTMKRMDYAGLKRVYNQVHKSWFCKTNGKRVQKFALDAFPMVGTDASVELMKSLISNEDITGNTADMWLASLAFIQRPTVKMVQEMAQLTGLPFLSTRILLPISALVHSYCQVNSECEDIPEVKNVLEELERNIQGGCEVNQNNFRAIMMSLRAIGNTGHAEASVPALYNCMSNKNNPMDIRVAAVQAFRRLSCATDRNNMMLVFRDVDEDSELRIAAYQGVMQCPTTYIVEQVKETLASEEVNQVGSFVWSHMTNLMESSDPSNKPIQQLLSDAILDDKFDLDKTKYSRNYEGSVFIDSLNSGAKIDSNLVWSTKSFVPRSSYLNLTTNLFGESLNLFEMGGRVEGLDSFLESYFGPQGYFNKENKDDNELPKPDPKFARLSGSKLDDIRKKAKTKQDDLRGAVFMRMFGNELSYSMFGSNNGIDKEVKSESDMLTFLKKWTDNKHHDVSLTRSFMFLDSTYTIPTLGGLPLNLMINGTATVALTAGGQLDLKKPASNVLIEGNIEPSGAVKIDSMMSIDAMVTKGGLKMTSTLHTSTGAKAKVQVTDGNVLDLTFDLTKDKQEILDVQNSFFIMYNEEEEEQKMIIKNRISSNMCTGDNVQDVLGLEFCTSFSMPNATYKADAPYFPFTGPVSASVIMHKRDVPNGYKFEAKTIKTPVMTLFRVLADTPGSTVNRAINLDINVQHKSKTLDVVFVSPWKTATLTGELIDTRGVKGLIGKLDVNNGDRLYNLDAKITVDETPTRVTYNPTISLEIPDWKNLYVTGVMKYMKEKSLDADFTITGATDEPITLQASAMNTDTQVGAIVKYNYEKGQGYIFEAMTIKKTEKKKLRSRHTFTPKLYIRTPTEEIIQGEGNVLYIEGKSMKIEGKITKVLKKDITLNVDITKTENTKKKRTRYSVVMKLDAAGKNQKMMFSLEDRQGKNYMNKLRIDYNFGKTMKDTLILQNRLKINMAKTKSAVKLLSKLNSMRNDNLDSAMSVSYARTKSLTTLAADLKYGKNLKSKSTQDKIVLNFEAKHKPSKSRSLVNYTMDFDFPAKSIEVKIKGGHIQEDKLLIEDIEVQYHPKRTVSVGLRLHNKTAKFPNYAGSIDFGLPQGRAMSFAGEFGRESEDKYISSVEVEIIKGRRTRIDTMLKLLTEKMYEAEVGVKLPDLEPVRVYGGYINEDKGRKAQAWFKRGEKLYSFSADYMLDTQRAARFHTEVIVPSRKVIFLLDGLSVGSQRNGILDIQWDADNNLDDRFLINMTSDVKGADEIELGLILHYPSRTITFDLKHSASARYITNVQLSWSPDDKVELDIIFRNDFFEGEKRTELSVMFTSPFEPYEELGLAVSLIGGSSMYQTKSSFVWAKNKKILVSARARVPLTLSSIDIAGTMTTPFKSVRSMTAQINHKVSDELQSFALFEWGPNRLSVKTEGKATVTKLGIESFDSSIDIRTPWEGLRIFLVSVEFTNNKQNKITSRLSLDVSRYSDQKDLEKYLIEMDMLYNRLPDTLANEGSLQITIPNDEIKTTWQVNLQRSMQHVSFTVNPKRGNNFKVELKNSWEISKIYYKYGTSFQLVIPAESFKELQLTFGFEARDSYVEAGTVILKDSVEVFSHDFKYQLSTGSLRLTAGVKCIGMDDISFRIISAHSIMPYRGSLEVVWAPFQKIFVTSSVIYNQFGMYDLSVRVNTPFPRYQSLVLSSTRKRKGLNWEATTAVDFAPRQKILLETTYRYDHVKLGSVSLKTPFPQFPGMETAVKVDGNIFNFKGDASFAMTPYVGKITSDFSWAYYKGTSLTGIFNLNTPYRQWPYIKAKVNSNILGMSRVSSIELATLPTQNIKLETDYRFTSYETLEGNVKVTSIYTDNKQVVAGFKHIGNREQFTTTAKITSKYFRRDVFTTATFSSKNGITSTFEMDSPFRGYETVKWNFDHKGTIKDFTTVVEYETNGNKIKLQNVFDIKKSIHVQSTLVTPFPDMSRAHLKFIHDGQYFNRDLTAEAGLNKEILKADVKLSQKLSTTSADVNIITPFKVMKKLDVNLLKAGPLRDFKAIANVDYGQKWYASVTHKHERGQVQSKAEIQTPLRKGFDINAKFGYLGSFENFESITELSVGPDFKSESKTTYLLALPQLIASHEQTTEIGGDVRKYNFTVSHDQNIKPSNKHIDIKTKVLAQIADHKASLDFGYLQDGEDLKMLAVLELPIEGYEISKMFGERSRVNHSETSWTIYSHNSLEISDTVVYEEKVEMFVEYDRNIRANSSVTYGPIKVEQYFEPFKLIYHVKTPYEGYESTRVYLEYTGNLHEKDNDGDIEMNINGKLTQSSLPADVETVLNYKLEMDNEVTKKNYVNWMLDYGDEESIVFTEKYEKGHYNVRLTTPYESYSESDIDLKYDKFNSADLTISSSTIKVPIKASVRATYSEDVEFDVSANLISGFMDYTNVKTEVRNTRSQSMYKPYLRMSWENEGPVGKPREAHEIVTDATINFNYPEFKDMTAGFSISIKTPFESMEDMKVQYDHKHFVSPMRAKEGIFIRFNNKKYLDMDAEIGAVSKFTGSVIFKSPREMEFSFSGLNEGESVDFDLNLNWNKQNRKSMFRLQFGLADDSNIPVSKKIFHVRVTNPNKIISIHNTFEMKPNDYIKSDGKLSWDEENKKQASYSLEYTERRANISSKLVVTMPTRTVEISGATADVSDSLVSSLAVYWDAETDRDKMGAMTMTLTPKGQQKAAFVAVKLPSMKKELTLKSNLAVPETGLDIVGNTEFSYAPETHKTIHVSYSIQKQEISATSSVTRTQWSWKHAETDTDIEMTSVLSNTETHVESDTKLQYTTGNKVVSVLGITADLDKENQLLDVQMTAPDDTAHLTGQLTTESPYVLTIDLVHNNKPKWNTKWTVDTTEKTLEASMIYGDKQRQIITTAFFPNATSFESETTRETATGLQQEGYMTANLNYRVLHGHLKWRPEIFEDVINFGADCVIELGNEINTVVQTGTNGFSSEVQNKYRSISTNIVAEMAPLSDTITEEVRLVQKDLKAMRRTLKKMHKNNELYLGTLEKAYTGSVKNMLDGYSIAVQRVGSCYRKVQELMQKISDQIDQYPLQEKYTTFKTEVSNFIEESKATIETEIKLILQQIAERIQLLSDLYDKTMDDISADVDEYFYAMIDEFALKPYLKDLKAMYEKLQNLQPSLKDLKVQKFMAEIHQLLIKGMEQTSLPQKYRMIADKAQEVLGEEFTDLLKNEDIRDIYELVQEIYEQVTLLYKYTEIDTTSLRDLIDKLLADARERIIAEFNQLPLGILDMHKSKFTTFDLENGEIEFDLYLPIPMENFEKAMQFTVKKYIAKLKGMADKYFPRRDICLWDFYYRFPPVQWSMRKDWVPPFDAYATVSGKQHYRTFDGRHFDLAGMCSYVLAEDLVDGNFSVVQGYVGGPRTLRRQSLTVMVKGTTIEMQQYLIKIDGKPRELPYESNGVGIVRKGSKIFMATDIGLDIVSDFHSDFHIIGLSGWYHGKVAGLLGFYDNEPYNDMILPEGELVDNSQKFINSWEVDSSCRSKRLYADVKAKQKSAECSAAFELSSSSLRPCFLQVDPEEYQIRCDMKPAMACDIAALYIQTCHKHGITVSLPQSCIQCEATGKTVFKADEPLKFERTSSSAASLEQSMDVVFVVEERQCNRDMSTKLGEVVYQLEQAMRSTGVSDNRYSLVGYEGKEISSHTMEGQLFNEATKFAKGIENLKFRNLGPYTDPVGALSYATELPFRPGVTKTIVLVSCSQCQSPGGYAYSRLASQLKQRDITMHILRENGFQLKNNRIPKSEIYGLDKSQVYLGRTRPGEEDLFTQISVPADYCAELALSSNGSVFDASNTARGSVRQQKAFLGDFGSRIAATETGSECQLCSCEIDDMGVPRSVCRRCDLQEGNILGLKNVMKYVVQYKNDLSNTIQTLLY